VFLSTIGLVAIGYTSAATVRRRRSDLALLRTLGMTARDLRRVVFVQTSILTGSGATLGAVLGVVVGRQVWRLAAERVHMVVAPVVPPAIVFGAVIGALLVAHVATVLPRRRAGHLQPAQILRAP
jgi:putative ABC transport system permease protein